MANARRLALNLGNSARLFVIDDGHFAFEPAHDVSASEGARFVDHPFRFDTPFHRISGVPAPARGPRSPQPGPQPGDVSPHVVGLLVERLAALEGALAGANAVLDLHPEPILVVDARGEVVRDNPAARRLFGTAYKRKLSHVLADKPALEAAQRVLAGQGLENGAVVDFTFRPAGGSLDRHLRARIARLPHAASPAYGSDGAAALVAVTDLTEVKRAEQLRADFVANASHELRTPLAILLGFLETLTGAAADDPEAQRRFLPIMQQQAGRMARLVDDLLALSRIELTEHAAPTARVDLAEIVGPVARALTLRAAERAMTIELDLAHGLPAVLGEAEELAQVFQNLIDNAIKYARPATAITVSAGPSPKIAGGLVVRVKDRGEGIAKRHLARLTERFYRVDRQRSRAVCGTGLGLAIVKHVVNRHQGVLEITSKLGKGSVFSVHLAAAPRGTPARAEPAAPESRGPKARGPGAREPKGRAVKVRRRKHVA
jgi:two-component system phosphate regulon sensor histidine kinase PhoR